MSQQDNQRRQLPRRASRGVRPQQTQQQKNQDDQVYNNIFGDYSSNEQDQSFSRNSLFLFLEMMGLKPLQTFSINFTLYNYGRGYHYFFDLDSFPRLEGSPSYASDQQNKFKHTYSQDQKQIKGTKLKNILNRKYFGLPSTQTTWSNKKSRDKNVCHYHLFNIEDKKFMNSRLICKYKLVLKNLQKLQAKNQLKYFSELKKDVVLHQICQKDVPIEKKKLILQNRIKVLQERVKNMQPYWDWEDRVYYHFSLDQVFHNDAMAKGQKLSQKYLAQYISSKITQRKQYIEGLQFGQLFLGIQKLKNAIQKWLIFEQQQNNALSTLMQNRLKALPKIIQMFRRKQELIIFPLFTFNFGSVQISRYIDSLIKTKLQDQQESSFYIYKSFIKRLLKRDLACQQGNVAEPIIIQEYTNQMRRKIIQIEDFYKNDVFLHKKIVHLDELVQMEKIQNSPIGEKINLLESESKIQINIKQLMLLFFYRNISIALEQFIEYMKFDPQILKLISNQNYDKYHYAIAKILHKPQFCILINDLTRFTNILNNKNVFPGFQQTFYFTFNQKLGVGYAWKQESEDWQTQKSEIQQLQNQADQLQKDEHQRQDGQPHPRKKVKPN